MPLLTFLTYKWRPKPGYRSNFTAENVNVLARMVARHYARPHRFICYTDDQEGIDPGLVDAREIWDDYADLADYPRVNASCFRRLKMYARDASEWLGERIVMMDLDIVITGDLEPVLDREEDFVMNSGVVPSMPYNGSLTLFSAGARPQLWEDFGPDESLKLLKSLYQPLGDDAWVGAKLGPDEAKFTPSDGVYSFKNDILGNDGRLPPNAAVVVFHGRDDPDGLLAQRFDWVRHHYR